MNWTAPRLKPAPLLYGVAAASALYQLFVLALAMQPQVSEKYRAYFITRETKCWVREPSFRYQLGTLITLGHTVNDIGPSQPYLGCGWWVEDAGTRMRDSAADLQFLLPPSSKDLVLKLEAQPSTNKQVASEIKVFADDVFVTTWTIPKSERVELTARLPRSVTDDGTLQIRFESAQVLPARKDRPSRPRRMDLWIRQFSISQAD